MRLKSVYISQYKNLKAFTLSFDGNSFTMSLSAKTAPENLSEHQVG